MLLSDCAYAQADLRLCWSHIPHCWKSHALAQMLKRLQDTSLETLLNIFNYIWTTGKFQDDWQYATIIPIPKPGKDPAEPNNIDL